MHHGMTTRLHSRTTAAAFVNFIHLVPAVPTQVIDLTKDIVQVSSHAHDLATKAKEHWAPGGRMCSCALAMERSLCVHVPEPAYHDSRL